MTTEALEDIMLGVRSTNHIHKKQIQGLINIDLQNIKVGG